MEMRIINISPELHKQFKAAAALNSQNMSDVIRDFMREYVNNNRQEAQPVKKKQPGATQNMLMDIDGNWIKGV